MTPWLSAPLTLTTWAYNSSSGNAFEWDHAWSYQRILYAVALAVGLFVFLFLVLFPAMLAPTRDARSTPWPLTLFGRCLALSVFLATCSFLLFFAWLEDELRRTPLRIFPNSMHGLNLHGRWLGVLLVGSVVSVLILVFVRHREGARKARA
jgi:hypothetical protein